MSDDEVFSLTNEQHRALDLDRNIAITAGAGTGKTTTLEERYRHILASDPAVDPTNILTITFTRDATAELREGIREVIDEQLAAASPGEYDRWRQAKDAVEDAYVHTIHGFCSRVLREFAVEAAVHPDVSTLDETDSDVLVTRVAREIIIAALNDGGNGERVPLSDEELHAITPAVRKLSRLYSREELVSLMRGLISERPESDRWADELLAMEETEYVEAVIARAAPIDPGEADTLAKRSAVCDAMATIEMLTDLSFDFTADEDSGRATLSRIEELLPEGGFTACSSSERQTVFLALCDAMTTSRGERYAQSYHYAGSATRWKKHGLDAEYEAFVDACSVLVEALEPETRDLDVDLEAAGRAAPFVFATARLYQVVSRVYEHRKRARNALDYADLIDRTITFLESHEAARAELSTQFEYIMIDEVQDTDPRQWELVRLLTGSETDTFDGRNVFLVGDEKQSIYRFRRADVTIVRRTRDQLEAANPSGVSADEELSGNFRTLSGTLAFINDLFDRVFEPEDADDGYQDYEAKPQTLTPRRTAGTEITGTVEYLITPARDEDVAALGMEGTWFDHRGFASRADREAQAIAARLTRLFEEDVTIYDEEADSYRPAEPSDVALLFRTRSRLRDFERAFEDHHIPYTSTGGRSLYETPEIQPLVNLLRVLQHPERDVPLYGVLRSPLFGFTDEELTALYHPDDSLWTSLHRAEGRLSEAADRLIDWRERCGRGEQPRVSKWGAFISRVVDETGYLVSVGADERPTQAVVNVNQFRERLRGLEEGSALPLADVLTRIEREQEFGDTVGEGEVPTDVDGVQLRTVHSAKGLEFPIVVVPELGRGTGGGATISHSFGSFSTDLAYLEAFDGKPVLGIRGPDPSNPVETTKTPDWQLAARRQAAEERAEAKRLLYVAVTRARDHLILSSTHKFAEAEFCPAETGDRARCFRDWVQPVLLDDRDLLEQLRSGATVECSLPSSTYFVKRPPAPVSGPGVSENNESASHIEIPAPEHRAERTAISATVLRDLMNEARENSPAVGERSEPSFAEQFENDGLSSNEFGDLVHRLCELQLSGVEIDWDVHPRRVVANPDVLDAETIAKARIHVKAGVDAVESLECGLTVHATAEELPVRLTLPAGEVTGDIDHLTVTEDRYYVTDYKTDSLENRDLETKAAGYWPQLAVYACALQQAAPKEEVVLRLAFTHEPTVPERRLDPAAIAEYEREFNEAIRELA